MMDVVLAYESKDESEENKEELNRQKTIKDGSNMI
jgi:hypothetical protein